MSKIYFFTDETAIVENQNQQKAFGPQPDVSSNEIYNLDNRLVVSTDAPVYAITKGLILAIADPANASLLNLALLPINSYTSGFPVKLFIYRGIKKESLILANGNIAISDSSWNNKNILKVIKDLQDDINVKTGTPNQQAISDSLGYNYSSLPDSTYIEKIFFDDTDDFHPILVDAGCQIGKFFGGAIDAGVEIVIDKIGSEPKLSLLKMSSHQFQIPKLIIDSGLTDKEKLILKFNNRLQKEEVLAYLDITAFYGATKNQNLSLSGVSNGDDFLVKFYNKHVVYIDIRDDRGFSYNHFFKLNDQLEVGFYSSNTSETSPVYSNANYYDGWPLLKLNSLTYNNSKKFFFVTIPILIGEPENLNFISCLTSKVSTDKQKTKKRHTVIAVQGSGTDVVLKKTEPIKLENWKFSDNKLGANYFLIKKSSVGVYSNTNELDVVWNNFFSLKMNNIFGDIDIDGHFNVYTYSSINNPLIVDQLRGEVYNPTIGIAFDKSNVTFFSYKDELVYDESNEKKVRPTALIGTGKFKKGFNSENFEYDQNNPNQCVGFLNQLINSSKTINYDFERFSFSNADDNTDTNNSIQFLSYIKNGKSDVKDGVLNTLKTVTLSLAEYNELKVIEASSVYTDNDFFINHPMYISGIDFKISDYGRIQIEQQKLTLGVVGFIDESEVDNDIDFVNYPVDILVENEPIEIVCANFRNI